MALLGLGIALIVIGLLLGFTNFLGFAAISGPLVYLGWVCLAIGVVLAIVHLVTARRTTVVERRYRGL